MTVYVDAPHPYAVAVADSVAELEAMREAAGIQWAFPSLQPGRPCFAVTRADRDALIKAGAIGIDAFTSGYMMVVWDREGRLPSRTEALEFWASTPDQREILIRGEEPLW